MRSFRRLVVALVVLGVWTVPSRPAEEEKETKKEAVKLVAQEGAIRLAMLRQKSVQEELKLEEAAVAKIHEFTKKQWDKAQELKSEDDTNKAKWDELAKENTKFLHDNLSKEQLHRLNQITMQRAGLLWVLRPEVAKKLELTEEQKEKALKLHEAARKEAHEFLQNGGSEEEKVAKMKEIHQANRKALHALLTEEQQKIWKEMAGEPFKGEFHFPASKKEE
jgi:hypothetical protein